MQLPIPQFSSEDRLIWHHTDSRELSFKDDFLHLHLLQSASTWGKLIWSQYIPPSRSFFVWRIIHNRIPTDDNLRHRGCVIVSMCQLCGAAEESIEHLVVNCVFARAIWDYLSLVFHCPMDLSSAIFVLSVCDKS